MEGVGREEEGGGMGVGDGMCEVESRGREREEASDELRVCLIEL